MLIRYILARVDSVNRTVTEIIKGVTIVKVIKWIQTSWADVSEKTIKNCFEKLTTIALNPKTMKKTQWKTVQNQ